MFSSELSLLPNKRQNTFYLTDVIMKYVLKYPRIHFKR